MTAGSEDAWEVDSGSSAEVLELLMFISHQRFRPGSMFAPT